MPPQQPEKDLKKNLISQQGPTGLKNYIELVSSANISNVTSDKLHTQAETDSCSAALQLQSFQAFSTSNQRPWELGGTKIWIFPKGEIPEVQPSSPATAPAPIFGYVDLLAEGIT